jgi:outer membrane protein assembly factor BamB
MRHDQRNTGESPIEARFTGDRPWSFNTGRAVFSTPVIGADGTVYVGSADGFFYAISRSGKLLWRVKTGNLIDSAAVLGRARAAGESASVTFGSGDEYLYQLRTSPTSLAPEQRVVWRYKAPSSLTAGQQVAWWEGNVELAPGGDLLAGNTGGAAFDLHPNGTLAWRYAAGNSVWTSAAVSPDGTSYWGSLSGNIFALDRSGHLEWSVTTLGFVISSPALGSDGTLYAGSFDGKLYAINSRTGAVLWTYPTSDNIYSSPALLSDSSGRTVDIIFASTNGSVYALNPAGHLLWRYDTGDVVRSSPVIGAAPASEPGGHIVYVGADDGRLYALDAATGQRRWSFDTTSSVPALRDRNDLNSSPALGTTGVYIASEDGAVWYVPYDYCLHVHDPRCAVGPGGTFPSDVTSVYLVTPGGSTQTSTTLPVAPESVLPLRLVVRRDGVSVDAGFEAQSPPSVTIDPPLPFSTTLSGDGHYLFVVPEGFLDPGTAYTLTVAGAYQVAPPPLGDGSTGTVRTTLTLVTSRRVLKSLPLTVGPRRVSALNLTQLAIPLPAFLPSVNQIGFDSYNWIVSTLSVSPPDAAGTGQVLMFVVGAVRRPDGSLVAYPATKFAFPLEGTYQGDLVSVSASDVTLPFSFGPVPMRQLTFRMRLTAARDALPGSSLFGVAHCADVPYYGPLLLSLTHLCNASGDLPASGTFLASGYPPAGAAANAPPGLSVASITVTRPTAAVAGSVAAVFRLAPGTRYAADAHVVSIVLTDAATGALVQLDYRAQTATTAGAAGQLRTVVLRLPAGLTLPADVRATVVTDAFPLRAEDFSS